MIPRDALCRYPLFALMSPAELDAWVAAGQEMAYATGETIFQAGTLGAWAYLVLDGQVRVVRPGMDNPEVSLARIGRGQVFGEYALVPPGQNTATCRSASPCRLMALPLGEFHARLQAMPQVSRRLKDWMRLHALVSYFRDEPFLGFMTGPSALKWLDCLQEIAFEPQTTIQVEGLSEDRWFFIVEGNVTLHKVDERGTAVPRELGRGECFGEAALAGRTDLPLAVSASETRCLSLRRADFDPLGTAAQPSAQSLALSPAEVAQLLPWVGQQEATDCSLAALGMIARFFEVGVDLAALRDRIQLDERGASLLELARIAESIGLHCQPVRIGDGQYWQLRLPAIAHYRDGHYVVLYEYSVSRVWVGDPATGIVRVSRDLFHQMASGHFLLLRLQRPAENDCGLTIPERM